MRDAGARAERLEQGYPDRADRHPDLEAAEVGRRVDGLAARGDLAEAVVPHLLHGQQADLLDLRANEGAEIAVHRRPHDVVVLEGEADAVDAGCRHHVGEHESRLRVELERATAHLAQHVGIGAELAAREDPDLEPTLGLLQDALGRLLGCDIDRMGGRQGIAELVGELRRPGVVRGAGEGERRRGSTPALKQLASGLIRHGHYSC